MVLQDLTLGSSLDIRCVPALRAPVYPGSVKVPKEVGKTWFDHVQSLVHCWRHDAHFVRCGQAPISRVVLASALCCLFVGSTNE